jgi:hypothetical protein
MFPYHNRLKQLLNAEEYIVLQESGEFSYRFYFPRINKSMPIRAHRNKEYKEYINKNNPGAT